MIMRTPLVRIYFFRSRSFRTFWVDFFELSWSKIFRILLVDFVRTFQPEFFESTFVRTWSKFSELFGSIFHSNFLGRRSMIFRTFWVENYSSLLVRFFRTF